MATKMLPDEAPQISIEDLVSVKLREWGCANPDYWMGRFAALTEDEVDSLDAEIVRTHRERDDVK